MSVGSLCRRPACTVSGRETVRSAAERMDKERVGALVVAKEDRPVGILTDRDLVIRVVARGERADAVRVADVASMSPTTLAENEPLERAVEEMRAQGARRMPVVDSRGHLVGLLSSDDLVRLAAQELTALADVASEQCPHRRRPAVRGISELRDAAHYAKRVTTVAEASSAQEVARVMQNEAVGCVVVVDAAGKPCGVLTDRDLARRVVASNRDPSSTNASEIMSGSPLCLEAREPLQHVVEAMSENGFRRIPIVRDGQLTGIVTYDGVLVALGDELHALGDAARRTNHTTPRDVERSS
jgi:CBS domain-containing protein